MFTQGLVAESSHDRAQPSVPAFPTLPLLEYFPPADRRPASTQPSPPLPPPTSPPSAPSPLPPVWLELANLQDLPMVCCEHWLVIFKHYWQGQVYDALFHRRCFFLLERTFPRDCSLEVYTQALQWSVYGREVLVTWSHQGYKLWVEQFCMIEP